MSSKSPRNVAMNLLARREHSVAELKTKLAVRELSPEDIDEAVDKLIREGLVSDERFAEAFVAYRMRRGQGPVRIRAELVQRGVCEALISKFLDSCSGDWFDSVRTVREKRFGPEFPTDFKERARQSKFLQYRGFTSEQIRQAFATNDTD